MKANVSKVSLSEPRKRLVELMQNINFGRIENLAVHAGEPVSNPPPRIVREIKFGGDNGPRMEGRLDDFPLKTQVVEMFQHFDRVGHGVVETLEIKHGLPFRMLVAETAA